MSESQARNAAKARGYTDKQIDAATQKKKLRKLDSDNLYEVAEKIGLPELGKSMKLYRDKPYWKPWSP